MKITKIYFIKMYALHLWVFYCHWSFIDSSILFFSPNYFLFNSKLAKSSLDDLRQQNLIANFRVAWAHLYSLQIHLKTLQNIHVNNNHYVLSKEYDFFCIYLTYCVNPNIEDVWIVCRSGRNVIGIVRTAQD